MNGGSILAPGVRIDRYRILSLLGRGGMGEVWLAHDDRFDREVAIKTMTIAAADDPARRARFLRETADAARVVHPSVATVFDVIVHEGTPLIVMERVRGRRLDDVIRDGGMTCAEIARCGAEIADGLAAIHAAGLLHRDLKPGNVMLTEQGHVKVMDLGVAYRLPPPADSEASTISKDSSVTRPGAIAGTVAYMSPEQLRDAPLDPRSDLFSLGVVLWEAAVGRHPFPGATAAEVASSILTAAPGTEAEREEVRGLGLLGESIARLLEKEAPARPPSAAEVASRLRDAARERPPAIVPPATSAIPSAAIIAACALGVALAGAVAWRYAIPPGGLPPAASRTATRPARTQVAVLPLVARSESTTDPLLGRMVADLLSVMLAESPRYRAVPHDRILEVMPSGATRSQAIRRASAAFGPGYVVAGALYREEGDLIASFDVYAPKADEPQRSFQARGRRASELARRAAAAFLSEPGAPAVAGFAASRPEPSLATADEAQLLHRDATELARRGEYARGVAQARRAIAIDPGFIDAHLLLAGLLSRVGLEAEARDTVQKARRLIAGAGLPEDGRQTLQAAALSARILGSDSPVPPLRRLVTLYPDEPDLLLELASALNDKGERDEALGLLDTVRVLNPLDPREPRQRASILTEQGDVQGAAAALDLSERRYRALDIRAGIADVEEGRGFLDFRQGQYEDARSHYLRAAELFRSAGLEPRALTGDQSVADMDIKLWRVEAAVSGYRAALEGLRRTGNYKQIVDTLSGLGGLLLRAGRVEEADRTLAEAADEARKLGGEALMTGPLINRAWVLSLTGRQDAAARLGREALEIASKLKSAPVISSARVVMAASARFEGRIDEAERILTEEIAEQELAGNRPRLSYLLGQLAELQETAERPAEAMASVDRALALLESGGPSVERAYRHGCRARLLSLLGRFEDAEAELERAEAMTREQDLVPQVAHMRARSRLSMALDRLEPGALRSALADSGAFPERGTLDRGYVQALRAEALLAAGGLDEALDAATREVHHPWATASSRAIALRVRAEALARLRRQVEGRREARAAFEAAARLGSRLLIGRSAAVVARLDPGTADSRKVMHVGLTSLRDYLASIPDANRDSVAARAEIQDAERHLTR